MTNLPPPPLRLPAQPQTDGGGRVMWALGVGMAVVFVALSVFGLLAYIGAFREPTLSRVTQVEANGDVCVQRVEGPSTVHCVPNTPDIAVEPGMCVLVNYGEGVHLKSRTDCPPPD